MLGATSVIGIQAAAIDMRDIADKTYKDRRLYDINLKATSGFSADDLAAFRETEGTAVVMGGYSFDVYADLHNELKPVRTYAIPESGALNQISLLQGSWPEKDDECLVELSLLEEQGYAIGDQITMSLDEMEQYDKVFPSRVYTITGAVSSPLYISQDRGSTALGTGRLNYYIYLPPEAYELPVYTDIYVAMNGSQEMYNISETYNAAADSWKEILRVTGDKQIAIQKAERQEAQEKIDQGWLDYNKSLQEYSAGKAYLSKEADTQAQASLAEAKSQLEERQNQLDNAPEPEWFYFTRKDAASYESYFQDTLRLQKVGYAFPFVFFLVAILVSLTTMSRMVEEHRTQIGAYKALGYHPQAIMLKYLIYALASSGLGGILGTLIGSNLFPRIISDAYGYLYDMPPIATPIPLDIAVFTIIAAVASVVSVTLITCAGAMVGEPAILMRPKAPKAGKRVLLEKIPMFWNRLGFIGKVTVRNIFRYKRRFFMTLAGVAGCAALLLTAFGLHDSVGGVAQEQYSNIFIYDAQIYLKEMTRAEQRLALDELTPESRLYIREGSVEMRPEFDGNSASAFPSLIVPEDLTVLADYIRLFDPATGTDVSIPSKGVLITEKLSRTLNIVQGDAVVLTEGSKKVSSTVAGIVENYVLHFVYMSPQHYAELFGHEPDLNSLLLQGTFDNETLMKNDDVRAILQTSDLYESMKDSTDALGVVTVVLLILACALAFVVLFNLTIINITERMRELATIKVLGFQDTETAMYTYRENMSVTLMGIMIGLAGGVYLTRFVLTSVEIDLLKFPQTIHLQSFVLAAVLSFLFALFVNAVTYRKLVAIDMVESLKGVE